jgi:methionine synthase II (cobalamin-independent)
MFQSFNTTGIGSLPHTDPVEACRIIFDYIDIPFWPQLPHRSFNELMVPQYSEGFPFVTIEGEDVTVKKADEAELAAFYEAVANKSGFSISKDYAAGFYTFVDMLKEKGQKFRAVKGHITGPLTYTLSITDDSKRPLFFDEEMKELALELLKGKVSWQIEMLKPYADEVLIFADEPILSALGTSAYLGVSSEEAARMLREINTHIRECGGIAGIHCCGKADWPLVLSSGLDVFNYDSYFFWDTLSIYPEEIKSFIDNGGFIACGVVPTTDIIRGVDLDGLKEQLERGLTSLEKIGVSSERLRNQVLITPSCGTGSLVMEDALKVFSLLKDLRNSYVAG